MTGFGSANKKTDEFSITVEIRSLNSRYLDLSVKVPSDCLNLETKILKALKEGLSRGKVDLTVNIQFTKSNFPLRKLNVEAVKHYVSIYEEIHRTMQSNLTQSFAVMQDPSSFELLKFDGVLEEVPKHNSIDSESLSEAILEGCKIAIERLRENRKLEGGELKIALDKMAVSMQDDLENLKKLLPTIRNTAAENYKKRINSIFEALKEVEGLEKSVPSERINQEVIVLAEKSDIEEEVVRLGIHIRQLQEIIKENMPMGRKLDFICQELNREINTIMNKLPAEASVEFGLRLKDTTEKIRQQVQNIE